MFETTNRVKVAVNAYGFSSMCLTSVLFWSIHEIILLEVGD